MNKTTKRIIIGAGIAGVGFLIWRFAIKPKMVAKRLKKFEESQPILDSMIKELQKNNEKNINNQENIA
jgi:hypothetical protein